MTSKIKVDNINKVSDDSNIINKCGTDITMGQNGDTVIIPNGVTEQVQSGGAIQVQSGGSITIASGATITNNGTAVGLGRTGTVDWQTTPKTATFTAVNGEGYFCNTTSGTFEVDLPAGVAGAIVSIQDYNNTFDSNNLTVDPNGSEKINGGVAGGFITLSTEGLGLTFVYIDATVGWRSVQSNEYSTSGAIPTFITATGGTITTSPCGDYKIHTFTGPGTFCVSSIGNACGGPNSVDYVVTAGGGSGGRGDNNGAGAGAGGYRESSGAATGGYSASPLGSGVSALPVSVQGYTIAVGAGAGTNTSTGAGTDGSNSTFSTIISAGGGGGGAYPCGAGRCGGSGGGGGDARPAGSGNIPPVSPPQGNTGGTNSPSAQGQAGGGGATAAGGNGAGPGGVGGAGATSSINGTPTTRAGGGGGGHIGATAGAGGAGGGGAGSPNNGPGGAGTGNTGGGGGGNGPINGLGGAGGSGIVIIRYKFQ